MAEQTSAVAYPVSWLLRLPYPVRNMLRRWRGAVGMMIGVGLALGIVMTMLALGNASNEIYSGDFRKSGTDLYVITQGGTLVPVLPGDTPGTITQAHHVLTQIRGMAEVDAALGVMTWSMTRERDIVRRRGEPTELIATMGVDGDPTRIPNVLVLSAGRWLERPNEIVLGARLAREKSLGLNDTIRLNGRDFTIVGIGRLRGFGFSTDAMAYLDFDAFRQRVELGDVVNIIAIETAQPSVVRTAVQELGSFTVSDPADLAQQAADVNASSLAFIWTLSGFTLLIGGLFVSNMLSRSVAERRLEFATLRAIGIPKRMILISIAAEATLITIVAGLIGVAISAIFGLVLNTYMAPEFGLETMFAADLGLFIAVFAMALGLGVIAGLFPARQAIRVDPADVLREA